MDEIRFDFRMNAYRNALRAIHNAEPSAMNFMRWLRSGKRVNNPARAWSILQRWIDIDLKLEYIDEIYEDRIGDTYSKTSRKFPSTYFSRAAFRAVDSFTDHLYAKGVITKTEVDDCSHQLLKSIQVSWTKQTPPPQMRGSS